MEKVFGICRVLFVSDSTLLNRPLSGGPLVDVYVWMHSPVESFPNQKAHLCHHQSKHR